MPSHDKSPVRPPPSTFEYFYGPSSESVQEVDGPSSSAVHQVEILIVRNPNSSMRWTVRLSGRPPIIIFYDPSFKSDVDGPSSKIHLLVQLKMIGPASESVRGGLPCTVISLDRITVMQSYLGAPINFIKWNILNSTFSLVRLSSSLKIANSSSSNQHSVFRSLLYLRYGPMTKILGNEPKKLFRATFKSIPPRGQKIKIFAIFATDFANDLGKIGKNEGHHVKEH